MDIPFEPVVFGIKMNIHLILEYAAFFIGFRYYLYLKKNTQDLISSTNRLSILIGVVFGAFLGSRIMGFLENPVIASGPTYFLSLLNAKTIMGGLFGGLLGVELAKKIIKEKHSSGDLFTFPIYGKETASFLGMDLGDGVLRYPIALFEVVFLALLWVFLKKLQKTNRFLIFGLSSIQYLCILCLIYYRKTILDTLYANKKLYLL